MTWDENEGSIVIKLTDSMSDLQIIESSWDHLKKVSLINGYYTLMTLKSHPGKALVKAKREETFRGSSVLWYELGDADKAQEIVIAK